MRYSIVMGACFGIALGIPLVERQDVTTPVILAARQTTIGVPRVGRDEPSPIIILAARQTTIGVPRVGREEPSAALARRKATIKVTRNTHTQSPSNGDNPIVPARPKYARQELPANDIGGGDTGTQGPSNGDIPTVPPQLKFARQEVPGENVPGESNIQNPSNELVPVLPARPKYARQEQPGDDTSGGNTGTQGPPDGDDPTVKTITEGDDDQVQ
ncbi:hypothetical protein BKA66DRAFT_437051 [Pyrenochaeta sp. MPI-SDFR-AT-0127]|nr:hypothetical protein BKA66DRAFT_437051 [Pyrenochaeta sp. MPI-SDFR-AT-0127]